MADCGIHDVLHLYIGHRLSIIVVVVVLLLLLLCNDVDFTDEKMHEEP